MRKIFYFIAALLFVGCTNSEDINMSSVESSEIPQDTINIYANDPDVVWDEELGWVHMNCVETF